MAITLDNRSDTETLIVLDERFDFGSVEQFRKSYESIHKAMAKAVAIDFRNTRYMDSSALGMLLNAKGHFDDHGIRVKIINANEQIKKIFSISRFEKKFEIV